MDVEQRARFESWARARGLDLHLLKHTQGYRSALTADAWAAYQVALTPPEGYERATRDAARYNYLRSRLLDTCMFNDAGELICCDERNGPELDALIDREIDGRQEVKP